MQKLNWSKFTSQSFKMEMQHLAACTSLCAQSTYNTRGLADSARCSSHLYLKSSQQNEPGLRGAVQLCQSYAAESSESTAGTRCRIGYPIVSGMWHVLAGLSSPGLLFCSQIRDAYLDQGRFKLKKKKITLKYNPFFKIILKYYIFQICLLNTQEFQYSDKIPFKVSRKTAKLLNPDLKRQESDPGSAAESSHIVLLTLRRIALFCFEIVSPKLDNSWVFLWERTAISSHLFYTTWCFLSHHAALQQLSHIAYSTGELS